MRIKKTILIVDDDEFLTGAIQGLLEEDGHTVSCCRSGSEAIALSKEQSFDLVLTDYNMPGMKGDMVCRLLRHRYPDVFIIGCSSEHHEEVFLSAGADIFIKKDQLVQNIPHLMKSRTTH